MLPSIHHPRYVVVRHHLRRVRKGAGLTQVQLAERLQVDQTYVSKLERGERYIDLLFYLDWCRACGAEPSAAVASLTKAGA
ncbi:TPA: helix-turn-helix transcriptional regulator [Burkholderia vietnamiensis]|jgi:transcriptional regulator with XRE-family HTH domain|uniref:helix-turn-helix domain-containing protein n=1 Tax=Burkholderia sp. LMG 13014 TaxID=2709306 RepID=UPI00196609C0|nr:helix-turn-helix transcriptional regulator [Burkholderia sp. LMG 13014]HDR8945493.1 helix-turn-helix transcriptional regulator [Burkholderia vietnamiensis]HDR8950436.1 helix-turn-helix transcriptional regulator [Burkholderia vietnamiensis]HDR9206726.1 helix-turn-helix transcriptional regulator [Burkholderia vietnamiensis]